jgi:hypothetical protein
LAPFRRIGIIYQEARQRRFRAWRSVNNPVHHNTIVHRGGRARNGVVTDTGDTQFWQSANNNFDRNIYIVADDSFAH